MSIYTDEGHASRKDYFESLAKDYGVDVEPVYMLADLLGPDEDFDGLIATLDDMSMEV
ncbi:RNA polymerase [Desulfosporosinus lacus]|uniref:Uncharacterized protein n=1 Tax=Desulfosporosinus lacus DSM 15449 TaxID=1121420 RepID=A0A1M5V075_9FIRM|nr:RNA polymerase [Desulfosporosinus lacus]SHH68662.1 hypothetical protein SAMN02746098_01144 [Desulfosporosinus lacus DSM 15449]